jgi:gamma-glutamyltranspeptidase / glutathione hydrolase
VAEAKPAKPVWKYPLDAPAVRGANGMVASDARLASEVGVEILKKGGNAVDGAVATALALAVVYPQAGNIGGGGFAVVRTADGKIAALDFRETAPKGASRNMYLDDKGELTKKSLVGHLAAGVPGAVAGLAELHAKHGSLPWKDLVEPAIRLAEEGFVVDSEFANSVNDVHKKLEQFPASAALFVPGGKPLAEGATWKNPDLGKTLRRLAEKGPRDFYQGETAGMILAEMKLGAGLISKEDLRAYRPKWRQPVEFDYRGHHLISMPPPSSGGLVLALVLQALEKWELRKMAWHSPEAIHLEAEILRRAFALRNAVLGDPDVVEIPTAKFVSKEAVEALRAQISLEKATPSTQVAVKEGDHTTHFSVVDAKGGAVALTTTINVGYGAGVTVTGAGFLLNNQMDDFAANPGKANVFGLVQGERNAIAPGKRMLSSMSPTIVVAPDGKVRLVTGAAGGPTIITAVLHVITNVIDYDKGIVEAVAAPRFHHQHLPDAIIYEELGFTGEILKALQAKGHRVQGRAHIADAPSILRVGAEWQGSGDPRTVGSVAVGY